MGYQDWFKGSSDHAAGGRTGWDTGASSQQAPGYNDSTAYGGSTRGYNDTTAGATGYGSATTGYGDTTAGAGYGAATTGYGPTAGTGYGGSTTGYGSTADDYKASWGPGSNPSGASSGYSGYDRRDQDWRENHGGSSYERRDRY